MQNCSGVDFTDLMPYTGSNTSEPMPEQAIQYYRASSIVLTLDGYNNSASNDSTNTTVVPTVENPGFLDCVNATIGSSAPLVDGASMLGVPLLSAWAVFVWLALWLA